MRWLFTSLIVIAAACAGSGTDDAGHPAPIALRSHADSSSARADSAPPAATSVDPDTGTLRFDSAGHPIVPIVLRDACEGEDCGTRFAALPCLPTALRAFPSDTSPITIPLAEGDSADVIRRDLRIVSVGVVVLKQDFVLDQEEVEVAEGYRHAALGRRL